MKFQVVTAAFLKSLQNLITINSQNLRTSNKNSRVQFFENYLIIEVVSPELIIQENISLNSKDSIRAISFEIDIHTLFEYVNKISDEKLEIKINESSLNIRSNERTYSQRIYLQASKLTERELSSIEKIEWCFLNSLKEMSFAITDCNYSRALEGVYLKKEKDKFKAYATNGFVLAKKTFLKKSFLFDEVLIPKTALNQLVKVFKCNDIIYYEKTHDYLRFKSKETFFEVRLIDLQYLNVESLIPKKFIHKIDINRKKFLDFSNLLNKLTEDKVSVLELSLGNGECSLSSMNSEKILLKEMFSTSIDVELRVCFNAKYLIEILKFCENDTVTMSFNNSLSPFTITDSSSSELKESLLLPMRV